MTKMDQARLEAEAAVAVAEEKLRRLRELRWEAARESAGTGDDRSMDALLKVLRELDKLPDVPWSTGCFYSAEADDLHVYWEKPDGPTVTRWANGLVSLRVRYGDDGEERIVGCVVEGARGVLAREGVFLAPDPPNPSRAVQEAQAAGVCRVCRNPLVTGTAPAKAAERFGNQMHPHALVFNFGEEYAHQACLNQEAAEGSAA